jgi:very-short-patch-repair endonuclease
MDTPYIFLVQVQTKLSKLSIGSNNIMPKGLQGFQKGNNFSNRRREKYDGNYISSKGLEGLRKQERRDRISVGNIGKHNERIGLSWEEIYGIEKVDDIRNLHSNRMKTNNPMSVPEYRENHLQGILNSLDTRENKFFDTDIELKLESLLNILGVKYQKQVRIFGITISDFYLPDSDLYIFCDGNYWHSKPEKMAIDDKNNQLMKDKGIKFIRFWGKEILKDTDSVENKLRALTEK